MRQDRNNPDDLPEELDLTDEEPKDDVEPELVPDLAKRREAQRNTLSLTIVALFGFVVVVPLTAVILNALTTADAKELLNQLLPAVTGLSGSVVGFYFGSKGS